jgi:hypothetical protein
MHDSKRSAPERAYTWLKDNWWASVIVYTIPPLVITFVRLLGQYVGLADDSGKLNVTGIIIVVLALLFIIIFSSVKEYVDNRHYQSIITGQQYLEILLSSVTTAKSRKRRRFVEYIKQNHSAGKKNPFHEITQPETQMMEIGNEMQGAFADLFGVPKAHIGLSIVCKISGENEWRVPVAINVGTPQHISDLLANKNSSFNQVFGRRETFFVPDKRKAIADGNYVPGERDNSSDLIGSLIVHRMTIAGSATFVEAAVSVSTYGKFLYPDGAEGAERKIRYQVLPAFVERIKLELALLYIKHKLASV